VSAFNRALLWSSIVLNAGFGLVNAGFFIQALVTTSTPLPVSCALSGLAGSVNFAAVAFLLAIRPRGEE
jgi:hypothetical protein